MAYFRLPKFRLFSVSCKQKPVRPPFAYPGVRKVSPCDQTIYVLATDSKKLLKDLKKVEYITVIAHSLGARLLYYATDDLAPGVIGNLYLLGGAVSPKIDWGKIAEGQKLAKAYQAFGTGVLIGSQGWLLTWSAPFFWSRAYESISTRLSVSSTGLTGRVSPISRHCWA